MEKQIFAKRRVEKRKELLEKIVEIFKGLNPVAIHQFGSGVKKYKDEFSDIDVWVTFKDSDIQRVLIGLSNNFKKIAPYILRHHSRSWSPIGGSSNSVIHEFGPDLFVVDYYISKLSETALKADSKLLYGDDSLINKGEWRLNLNANKNIKDSHTLKKDVDLILDLIFISIKEIVRKSNNDGFVVTLKEVHKKFRKRYPGKLKMRRINLSLESNYKLLRDLYAVSNKRQVRAINKIIDYIKQIEKMYDL